MTSTDCCAKSVAGCELTWDYMPTGRTELRQRSTAGNTDSETAGWSRRPPGRPSPRTPGALPRNTRFIQHRDRPRQQPRARGPAVPSRRQGLKRCGRRVQPAEVSSGSAPWWPVSGAWLSSAHSWPPRRASSALGRAPSSATQSRPAATTRRLGCTEPPRLSHPGN